MVAVSDQELARADYFLSILPPSDALALAEKMAALIGPSNHKPIYVDCNAVSPPTKIEIGHVITEAGSPFVDAGIIGGPPKAGYDGPGIYASGPDAGRFGSLTDFGLVVHVMNGPIGAASAMKMSYAGITKGFTALGAMMMLAARARRRGRRACARSWSAASRRCCPGCSAQIPAMYSKAYRFVGEMEEISDYVGEDVSAQEMFDAFADFYTRLAADFEGKQAEVGRAHRVPQAEAVDRKRCARRSASSAPVRPGCSCRCCCIAPASTASCWSRAAATTSRAACAPACWSRAPST